MNGRVMWCQATVHFRATFAAVFSAVCIALVMSFAGEMKQNKGQFLREMYSIEGGRFGVLIDSYDVGEKYGFDWETLETIVEHLEAKGLIASYEGTLYASLTLNGVEYVESTE
ncbi:MAG: hypothetical protein WCI87_03085 [Euryarchaeota archaeon]